jgi:apolipoprotein N-acyltransferase
MKQADSSSRAVRAGIAFGNTFGNPVGIKFGITVGIIIGIVASAVLCGLCARGGSAWPLGFVMLVPWLWAQDACHSLRATLLCALGMALAFSAAVFGWFGLAIGHYTGMGAGTGLAVLLAGAPLFQPQFIAFALVRHWASRRARLGRATCALAAACGWVACEWLVPKLLGDTLGHGLYPSRLLRQGADLVGVSGLTFLLLLVNQALATALARGAPRSGQISGQTDEQTGDKTDETTDERGDEKADEKADGQTGLQTGWPGRIGRGHIGRSNLQALALAAALPLLLALYGALVLPDKSAPTEQAGATLLRIGMVQANLTDYERQRNAHGTYAAVRQILDTHFAMSYDAVVRQHADAVLWSETSYPTTFGQPKSATGAELDQTILGIVNSAGVPFVFGTYERDAAGEYNSAAFVAPGAGLIGSYRKTRLFPFTEYVPGWLDGPWLRPYVSKWLPWTGHWRPGNGARVFPLKLADGREVVVLPLICRDDVDSALGIAGARLGARAILTLSNDAWFTAHPQGAALHLAAAAFRSIETRLPQFRVTTNGVSALIDGSGELLTRSRMGEQALVVGALLVAPVPPTLLVRWGDWVGPTALGFLLLLAARATATGLSTVLASSSLWRSYAARQAIKAAHRAQAVQRFPLKVFVLPPAARLATVLLRSFARLGLLWLGVAILQNDALRGNTLAQMRWFGALFLVPEAASWCVLQAFAALASIEPGKLVLRHGAHRIELALGQIGALETWRWPLPCPGCTLRLVSGARWPNALVPAHPAALDALAQALGHAPTHAPTHAPAQSSTQADAPAPPAPAPTREALYTQARQALGHTQLDQVWCKYLLLPFALAFPAYYLHQHIAYGSGFGEYIAFGMKAYAKGLGLWWGAWIIGVTLCGAALRLIIEAGTLLALLLRPQNTAGVRRQLEGGAKLALYLGLPVWLLLRIFGG